MSIERKHRIALRYLKKDFVRNYVDLESKELLWNEVPVGGAVCDFLLMFQDIWEECELDHDKLGDFLRAIGEDTLNIAWDYAMVADNGCHFP